MKRHKNWQEWGRKRAEFHQRQRLMNTIYADINEVVKHLYERDPIWKFVQNPGPCAFHSGSEMRIPLQFEQQQA